MKPLRERREPPRFRTVEIVRVTERTPFLTSVTLAGPELEGFDIGLPASSVRLLLGEPDVVVLPTWRGNEFLLEDDTRPLIRTLTPLRFDEASSELDVEVVLHGEGPLSAWAEGARVGDVAAVSGTGRGYDIDVDATTFLLLGDESAVPAIGTVLRSLPVSAVVKVAIEVGHPGAKSELSQHGNVEPEWLVRGTRAPSGSLLFDAVKAAGSLAGTRIWAAGEAASMQKLRKYLFNERGIDRSMAVVRGYWKHG